jgi:hypothetical protein
VKPKVRVRLPKPSGLKVLNDSRVMVICVRLSRMHKPMVETEAYGGKALYKSAVGIYSFSNMSFEVGPVMVQRIRGTTN